MKICIDGGVTVDTMHNVQKVVSRRRFLVQSVSVAGFVGIGGCATARTAVRAVPRKVSPNEKLNIGIIGCGGRGAANATENIVALCDVDETSLQRAAKKYPGAKLYRDYRRMLDEERSLDAVVISTPDHHHAPAAMRAIVRGLHVYVEKPLTHNIWEARRLLSLIH
ncbi:MAG: Gfo/Idh/MocA family oxidoreductase, partial [Verrucomicrobiae bacterium]|nr:Gfo/Idh/MocA family oxidoreductase [Verrucomicrobiae bacterium]